MWEYAHEMITGKTIEGALAITSDELLRSLDGLPEENVHCSVLALNVLQEAIGDYRAN